MTTYKQNAATIENAIILQQKSTHVIDAEFNKEELNIRPKKQMPLYGSEGFKEYASSLDTRSKGYRIAKRLFDAIFSIIVIVVACIPLLVLLICTTIDTKAVPIYFQERIEHRGPFRFYKLRSMVKDSDDVEKYFTPEQLDQWNKEHKVARDPRVDLRIIETNAKRPLLARDFVSVSRLRTLWFRQCFRS